MGALAGAWTGLYHFFVEWRGTSTRPNDDQKRAQREESKKGKTLRGAALAHGRAVGPLSSRGAVGAREREALRRRRQAVEGTALFNRSVRRRARRRRPGRASLRPFVRPDRRDRA